MVVAELWSGAQIGRRLDRHEPSPTGDELDALARELLVTHSRRQNGVLPIVRLLEARTTTAAH